MLHKKGKSSQAPAKVTLEPLESSGGDQSQDQPQDSTQEQEISTRFLRDRENQLDRQTLRLAQALIEAGFKVTDPRLTIIEEIVNFRHGFEITDLTEKIENRPGPKPGVASVFRTVKLLTELGLLQRVHASDGCHRYELIHGHNHQVVCRCCEQTIEFEGCDFTELTAFLEKQTGFKLEGHWMEFFGLCPNCRGAAIPTPQKLGLPVSPLGPHDHTKTEQPTEQPARLNVSGISQNPG
jgi:Fur family ferric uptake transcriptional regulator